MDTKKLFAVIACVAAMIGVLFFAVDNAMSETLDEKSLRDLYKKADGLLRDPKKLEEFLNVRVDENFVRQGQIINSVEGKPDEITPVSMNKAQSIDATLKGLKAMKITKYDHKIIDIKFSADNKWAYISSSETSSGTLEVPVTAEKTVNVPFNEGSACVDTLTLVKAVIKILRTECTNKIALLHRK